MGISRKLERKYTIIDIEELVETAILFNDYMDGVTYTDDEHLQAIINLFNMYFYGFDIELKLDGYSEKIKSKKDLIKEIFEKLKSLGYC